MSIEKYEPFPPIVFSICNFVPRSLATKQIHVIYCVKFNLYFVLLKMQFVFYPPLSLHDLTIVFTAFYILGLIYV